MKMSGYFFGAAGFLLWAGCVAPSPLPPPQPVREAPAAAPAGAVYSQLPRVMALIDEQNLGSIPTAEVESAVLAALLARGAPTVDQEMARSNIRRGQEFLKQAGDPRAAAALGQQYGADVLIIGEAVAKPSARRIADSNLRTYQAAVTLRAVRTDNSATLATVSEDASVIGLDDVAGSAKAFRAAGQPAADKIVSALLAAWEKHRGAGPDSVAHTRLTLTVGGVDQLWKLKALRDRLRAADAATRNVAQRSYTAGVAIFDLETPLPAEEFAETLVTRPPDKMKLQALNIGPGQLDLRAAAVP